MPKGIHLIRRFKMQYYSESIIDRLPKYCPFSVPHGVWNHRRLNCLFQSSFKVATDKNLDICVIVCLWGEPTSDPRITPMKGPVAWEDFMSWRHHGVAQSYGRLSRNYSVTQTLTHVSSSKVEKVKNIFKWKWSIKREYPVGIFHRFLMR